MKLFPNPVLNEITVPRLLDNIECQMFMRCAIDSDLLAIENINSLQTWLKEHAMCCLI